MTIILRIRLSVNLCNLYQFVRIKCDSHHCENGFPDSRRICSLVSEQVLRRQSKMLVCVLETCHVIMFILNVEQVYKEVHLVRGGVFSGKVGTGMCNLDRVPFQPPLHFNKMLNFQ